tara:strand:+ start:146922 stop:147965 length:1044 start_codon:yes stop_codon:yes gene_type:complete
MRAFLLTCFFVATAAAQTTTVTVPNLPAPVNIDRPFAGGIGRYQQWYNTNGFNAISEPMRFDQIEFLSGTSNGVAPQPITINCEVRMGHGKFSGVFGLFDSNWDSPPVIVAPTANRNLTVTPAGTACMTIPFTNQFTWDRVHPILIEIRIFGNNQQSQPFLFNTQGTTSSLGLTSRVYAAANAGATSGQVQQGVGMITRMRARQGAMIEYGTGCPGEGGFIPKGTANLAWPGVMWTQQLTNAPSQRTAFWVIGDTSAAPYPLDLTSLLGLGPSGCMLRTNPVNAITAMTVGGGAGSGVATLPIQLPGIGGYEGFYVFTQWVVFDPLAPNGTLAVTPGLWTIVAPIGG